MNSPETMTALAQEIEATLPYFYGTEKHHKISLGPLVSTDGVAWLAEKAGCYWLIDILQSYQHGLRREPFQIWTLKVNEDRTAVVVCERDTDDEILRQEIQYTDFPLSEIKLYVTNNVIMLPSEY